MKSENAKKIPYQKPSGRISVPEQRPESTSKGPDQRRRISVKDDPGSTWLTPFIKIVIVIVIVVVAA